MEHPCKSGNSQNDGTQIFRPLADFYPDIWGDLFLNYTPLDEVTQKQMEEEAKELKQILQKELLSDVREPKHRVILIDAVQRLGVAYHFEDEIEANFQNFHNKLHSNDNECYKDDLHYVSLLFRLLRQHGIYVSCDVFEKFKSEHGNFKESLGNDVQGILNLYEASHVRIHGENILDEALAFATTHLNRLATQEVGSPVTTKQIAHALKLPLNKRGIRLESRHQISFYESDSSHDQTLLRFAKLDFNMVQELHKMELKEHTRWSRRLDSIIKLPSLRDRNVEAYFWTLGAYFEPHYSYARMILNKSFKIISIVDDLYDCYGTFEELEPFTEAIQRWDKSCIDQLPNYMRSIYQAIVDTFDDLEQDFAKEGRSYFVHYVRQQIIASCQAYLKEAIWCHKKYVPTYEEYIKNGITSSVFLCMITSSYQGMGEIVTKNTFEWVNPNSKTPKATCIIARLLNDMASRKFEQKRDHVASAIECIMKQFGSTEEQAYKKLLLQVEEAWKDINQGMLRPTVVARPLLSRLIHLTRALYDIYDIDEDGYTMNSYLQKKVEAVLVDHVNKHLKSTQTIVLNPNMFNVAIDGLLCMYVFFIACFH